MGWWSNAWDTVSGAVVDGLAWTAVNVTPVGWVARGLDAAGVDDPWGVTSGLADKHKRSVDAITGFAEFAWENPGRAGALVGQGFVNGVTSTVGFVGDGARMIVTGAGDVVKNVAYNYTTRPLINAVYSLGQDEGAGPLLEQQSFFSLTSAANEGSGGAFGWSEWMNKNTQMIERIKPEILADTREFIEDSAGDMVENPDYMKAIDLKEGDEVPEYAQIIANPNANYERVLLYGGQALFEVPVFIATAVGTGGAGTAAYMARFGGKAVQTAATLKRVDMVADAIEYTSKAAKLLEPTTGVRRVIPRLASEASLETKAANLASKADEIAMGTRAASKGDSVVEWGRNLIMRGKDATKPLTQSDLMEYLAKHSDKLRAAQSKLDDLVESGVATERQLLNQARKVKNAENALEKGRESVNILAKSSGNTLSEVTADAAKAATRTTEELTASQVMREGFQIGARRGFRIVDPTRSPIMDTAGVGLSFSFGYYIDQKNAQLEIDSGAAISKGAADAVTEETVNRTKELGEDTSWFDELPAENDSNNNGEGPQNLKGSFPGTQTNPDGTPLPGGDAQRDQQSGMFNNRANGIVVPLDTPVFKVEVSDEAAELLRNAIKQ
tara:strand:+ start:12581 stop:14419 length:1839 start_codon:yes stop_codon:yes gene_type:complete